MLGTEPEGNKRFEPDDDGWGFLNDPVNEDDGRGFLSPEWTPKSWEKDGRAWA